jgi:hypothetical protein
MIMRPFLLRNDSFTRLNAEFNNEQLTKYTYVMKLALLPQTERSDIKYV